MKKIIFITLLSSINSVVLAMDYSEPDYDYSLERSGLNVDVSEFTPKSNPDYVCVSVVSDESTSVDCFPKRGKDEQKLLKR